MSEHSPEPWVQLWNLDTDEPPRWPLVCDGSPGHDIICEWNTDRPLDLANARRIVACVNACAGISTEELAKHGAAAMLPAVVGSLSKRAEVVWSAKIAAERQVLQSLEKQGYKITPPSRSDMSDKISRSLSKDEA